MTGVDLRAVGVSAAHAVDGVRVHGVAHGGDVGFIGGGFLAGAEGAGVGFAGVALGGDEGWEREEEEREEERRKGMKIHNRVFEMKVVVLDGQWMPNDGRILGDPLLRKDRMSQRKQRAFHSMNAQGCHSWPPWASRHHWTDQPCSSAGISI